MICQLDSLRPGKRAGDPVVTDIRGLLYKNGQIYYKLRQPHEWQLLPQRRVAGGNLVSLYDEHRKIEKTKFDSLQSLKHYMHYLYYIIGTTITFMTGFNIIECKQSRFRSFFFHLRLENC